MAFHINGDLSNIFNVSTKTASGKRKLEGIYSLINGFKNNLIEIYILMVSIFMDMDSERLLYENLIFLEKFH
jgi:hypothetical protein